MSNRVTPSSIEQCIICCEDMKDQKIGIPEHCEHSYCFNCLVGWAKEKNTCPIDRQIFQYIFKKHSFSSRKPYAKVDINNIESEISLEEPVISCHACDGDDQEYHPLLICTRCSKSYHEFCLNSFDISSWICLSCGRRRTRIRTFGLRDEGRTLRIAKPRRRLQQTVLRNSIQRIGNLITRNTTIQAQERHENNPSIRSVITPNEAARRIAASGIPVLSCPRSTALISQAKNMAALQRKRKRFARLPPKIPVNQLPRIQHRTDATLRPRSKTIAQRSNLPTSASFIDKLLHSQKQLYSLETIQIQGAHIKLS